MTEADDLSTLGACLERISDIDYAVKRKQLGLPAIAIPVVEMLGLGNQLTQTRAVTLSNLQHPLWLQGRRQVAAEEGEALLARAFNTLLDGIDDAGARQSVVSVANHWIRRLLTIGESGVAPAARLAEWEVTIDDDVRDNLMGLMVLSSNGNLRQRGWLLAGRTAIATPSEDMPALERLHNHHSSALQTNSTPEIKASVDTNSKASRL